MRDQRPGIRSALCEALGEQTCGPRLGRSALTGAGRSKPGPAEQVSNECSGRSPGRRGKVRTLISSPDSNPVSIRTVSLVAGGRWCSSKPVSGRNPLRERKWSCGGGGRSAQHRQSLITDPAAAVRTCAGSRRRFGIQKRGQCTRSGLARAGSGYRRRPANATQRWCQNDFHSSSSRNEERMRTDLELPLDEVDARDGFSHWVLRAMQSVKTSHGSSSSEKVPSIYLDLQPHVHLAEESFIVVVGVEDELCGLSIVGQRETLDHPELTATPAHRPCQLRGTQPPWQPSSPLRTSALATLAANPAPAPLR